VCSPHIHSVIHRSGVPIDGSPDEAARRRVPWRGPVVLTVVVVAVLILLVFMTVAVRGERTLTRPDVPPPVNDRSQGEQR